MDAGMLMCPSDDDDAPACPKDCSVCQTCLTLLGCPNMGTKGFENVRSYYGYIIGAAVGLIALIATVHYQQRKSRRRDRSSPMGSNLVELDSHSIGSSQGSSQGTGVFGGADGAPGND
eukprot:15356307-Ditylum_brightwellii.AAC.1